MERLYILGFNSGYILAKYEPLLLGKVLPKRHSENEFVTGLQSGKEEFEQEKARNILDELKILRDQSFDRENGLERNI